MKGGLHECQQDLQLTFLFVHLPLNGPQLFAKPLLSPFNEAMLRSSWKTFETKSPTRRQEGNFH